MRGYAPPRRGSPTSMSTTRDHPPDLWPGRRTPADFIRDCSAGTGYGFPWRLLRRWSVSRRSFLGLPGDLFHPSRNPAGKDVAGLYSIGVLPSLQGTGAGRKLVAAFLEEARSRGCGRVFLTTDRDGNDAVNEFYRKMGFRVEREYTTPEGRTNERILDRPVSDFLPFALPDIGEEEIAEVWTPCGPVG